MKIIYFLFNSVILFFTRKERRREKKCVPICVAHIHIHRAIRVHHTQPSIHIAIYEHVNIVRIVIHAVWCAYQRFDFVTFAIDVTGNVAIIKKMFDELKKNRLSITDTLTHTHDVFGHHLHTTFF